MALNDNSLSRTPTNVSATAPEIAAIPSSNNDHALQASRGFVGTDGIEYRYMTFVSPVPTIPVLPASTDSDLPQCPDLTKFTNPFDWPRLQKQLMTYLSCSVNACAAYAAGSYAAPEDQLTTKWGVSRVVYTLGITVFTLGFGTYADCLAVQQEVERIEDLLGEPDR
jgi:hypothetical protein